MFPKPTSVKALPNHSILLSFSDGVEGIVNLSHLVGKGVFKIWDKKSVYNHVYIDSETDAVAWNDTVELCADNLYLKIIGKTFEQWKEKHTEYATNK